jgi:hypothetical protein
MPPRQAPQPKRVVWTRAQSPDGEDATKRHHVGDTQTHDCFVRGLDEGGTEGAEYFNHSCDTNAGCEVQRRC